MYVPTPIGGPYDETTVPAVMPRLFLPFRSSRATGAGARHKGGRRRRSDAPIGPSRAGGLRELLHVTLAPASVEAERINLILPSIQPGSSFGGINTAIDFFRAAGADVACGRIISVDAVADDTVAAFPDYQVVGPSADSDHPRQIVSLAGEAPMLRVGPRDVFIATFWPTALLVGEIRRWQDDRFGRAPARFAYLIQDFEPGFYPRSAQAVMAAATYGDPESTVAVFNTALLREEFHRLGFGFRHEYTFTPRIVPALREVMRRAPVPRSRRIVVYGRPSKARNGFPLIVDGLRAWRHASRMADWSVESIGERHVDIDLGAGLVMHSLGKLDVPAYGDLLRSSAVGVSLMFSPHPSYPPIEMAALGLLVLTNRFGDKDLANWHDNITSVISLTPDGIGQGLTDLCTRFEAAPGQGNDGKLHETSYLDPAPQFPFAAEVAELLRA